METTQVKRFGSTLKKTVEVLAKGEHVWLFGRWKRVKRVTVGENGTEYSVRVDLYADGKSGAGFSLIRPGSWMDVKGW